MHRESEQRAQDMRDEDRHQRSRDLAELLVDEVAAVLADLAGGALETALQIARNEFVQLERILTTTVDRLESSRLADPDILLARIARDITHAILRQDVENESGAIHSPVSRIS